MESSLQLAGCHVTVTLSSDSFLRKALYISSSPIPVYFIHLNSEHQLISNWAERQAAQILVALLHLESVH